jgi:ribosomal protein L21E
MMVFGLLCYVLNMADAAVDAHFAKFDVSDNLTIKIEPSFQSFMGQAQMGLSIKLNVVDNRNRKLQAVHN